MDSITLLYEYQADIALALSFDYGSKHNARELPYARLHCERLGIEHLTIPLSFISQYFQSALLQGGGDIPKGSYDEQNMASTVVPFRNGIMLSIAAGLAESWGLDRVYIANHFGDHAIYPDCRASFIQPMHSAVYEGTSNHVSIEAPYTHISKGAIASHGKRLGIDYSETWSCYEGGDVQCGTCATCIERREAMQEAGIIDPTIYKENA
jgi:7-cyano-7-deazaguanine synthase